MLFGLFRVVLGFLLACLAAGAVKVAFAVKPAELAASSPERLSQAGEWALLAATESAVFAAPFAFIAIVLAEWLGIRTFAYHGLIGILIASAGFAVLLAGESPETVGLANSYAITAFLSTGLIAGVVYWMFAGRLSGGRRITRRRLAEQAARETATARPPSPTPAKTVTTAVPAMASTATTTKASVPSTGKIEPVGDRGQPRPASAGRA